MAKAEATLREFLEPRRGILMIWWAEERVFSERPYSSLSKRREKVLGKIKS